MMVRFKKVSELTGVPQRKILTELNKRKVILPKSRPLVDYLGRKYVDQIIKLYNEEYLSATIVGKKLGLSKNYVLKYLKRKKFQEHL